MLWVIIGGIYAAVINYFGQKAAWISFGIGLLVAIISMGSLATLAVFLVTPAILRYVFEIITPFIALWWEDVKSK